MKEIPKYTLESVLINSSKKYADCPSLSWADGKPLTYSELAEEVSYVSTFLKKKGIVRGDRVGILAENSPNWGIAYLAVTTMGAVVVPILPDFHITEITHILRHSGTKVLFVSEKLFHKVEDLEWDTLNLRILLNDFSIIPPQTKKINLKKLVNEGTLEIAKFGESAMKRVGLMSESVKEDTVATIIYTSGTTGNSKGVVLTHKNLVFDSYATLKIQNVCSRDRLLSILPLPHTYEGTIGFILPLIKGASIYYLKKPPTASVLLPAMQKIKPTLILTVPLIIEKIFKTKIHPKFTKNIAIRSIYGIPVFRRLFHWLAGKKLEKSFGGQLHFFGIGGALVSAEVERFLRDARFPYAIGYGLTETSPLIAGSSPNVTKYRATGVIIPGVKCRIANPNPKTGEGEIQVKGDTVMKGYYRNPQLTKEVFTDDGYFKTGDLGILSKNNYLYIKGRIKNIIIGPSGENIYPEEIENIINEHEYTLESLVYEQDNKITARIFLNYELIDSIAHKWDTVKLKKHINKILEDIKISTNQRVSQFSKINQIIEQQEPFEKTPTKKIKRYLYTQN